MSRTHIASTPRSRMNALRFQGILITDSHAQLQSMLERNLSPEHALLFSEPVPDGSGKSIDWYTPLGGPAIPLAELSPERRRAAGERIARIASDIAVFAESLKEEGQGPKFIRGGILSLALNYPGDEYIYMAGDQPLLTGWGFSPASLGMEPASLLRFASVAQEPAPAAQAAMPEESPAPKRAPGLLGPVLAFFLGLALLAGAYLLAALLFGPAGCAELQGTLPAGCAADTAREERQANATAGPDSDLVSALTAEEEKAESLRRQLEDLRRELARRLAECPRPRAALPEAPPAPEETPAQPEPEVAEPPSLADLMPTTPEPPPAADPPPKAETPKKTPPKPEPPKKEPPKQAEAPKSRDLVIPEGALENNDLSFLEGCWNNATMLRDGKTKKPIRSTYGFDKNGRGTRTEQGIGHDLRCNGSANARVVNGKLRITASEAQCSAAGRGRFRYPKEDIVCDRTVGGKADCYESKNDKWKAKLQRVK